MNVPVCCAEYLTDRSIFMKFCLQMYLAETPFSLLLILKLSLHFESKHILLLKVGTVLKSFRILDKTIVYILETTEIS